MKRNIATMIIILSLGCFFLSSCLSRIEEPNASYYQAIFVANIDGSNRVIIDDDGEGYCQFSPDGTRIIEQDVDNNIIYTMNLDGTNKKYYDNFYFNVPCDYAPITADGNWIIVSGHPKGRSNVTNIYKLNINTGEIILINNSPNAVEYNPSLTEDNNKIAFNTYSTDSTYYTISTMNTDGSDLRVITSNKQNGYTWVKISPNGHYLFYKQNNKDGIYRINLLSGQENLLIAEYKWLDEFSNITLNNDYLYYYNPQQDKIRQKNLSDLTDIAILGHCYYPMSSNNGRYLFYSFDDNYYKYGPSIYKMDIQTGHKSRIANGHRMNISKDGSKIVYKGVWS